MTGLTKIYGLIDPRDGQLRYVGKTLTTLHRRLLGHVNDVGRGRVYIPRHKWIFGLLQSGARPEIFLIEEVPTAGWQDAERFWISYFRSIGCALLNATAGGDGIVGHKHKPETLLKMAATAKARYADAEERKKTGASVRAAYQGAPEARAVLSMKSKNRSPETRRKLSVARKAYLAANPEIADRLGALNRGMVRSQEERAHISKMMTGKKRSPESVAKTAAWHTGKKRSAETRAKQSAAALAKGQGSAIARI